MPKLTKQVDIDKACKTLIKTLTELNRQKSQAYNQYWEQVDQAKRPTRCLCYEDDGNHREGCPCYYSR